ncbi:MAG: Crp/Fnr family transcriptional regulator [Gammaproteobacteria bacterium]|nr:Crp/Fnr family transcriptional regulator [Gammaproteobacteria bacterium]NNJ98446.1 Crp/Fnr family transcriptional regulator [Gammaproteobacteria bacterium]
MEQSDTSLELKLADREVLSNVFPEVSSIPDLEHYRWRKKIFTVDEVLFNPGQACDRFMLLGRGVVRVELQNPQARSMVLYRIEPGQLCIHSLINLINDDVYSFIAIAETDGWFCWADKENFQRWMKQSDQFQRWVFNNIGFRFKQVVDRYAQHAFLSVESRLAGLLIEKMGPDQMVHRKQSEMAAELGTAREIISRHLSRWQKQHLLETHRGGIKILDVQTLVDIAV